MVYKLYADDLKTTEGEPFQKSMESLRQRIEEVRPHEPERSSEEELKRRMLEDVPYSLILIGLYLGVFLSAEAAFVLMALREYLQDLLGLSDVDLIAGVGKSSQTRR
jgi:hypothetical protein